MIDTLPPSPPVSEHDLASFRTELAARRRIPISTYRLQLTPSFTFDHAREIIPYLARLGITDIYCSPIFRAKPGSTHGYDVCDFGELNPELGGEESFAKLADVLNSHGMGLIQDFVPNHMAVEPVLNPWWRNMLEHGPASPYASYFDIDWNPTKPELRGKVLLPFLGDHYGHVLERGELVVEYDNGGFVIRYFSSTRPVDPRQYPQILRIGLPALEAELGEETALAELLSVITALDHLPPATESEPERVAERLRESRIAKDRIARLVESTPRIEQHISQALREINGIPGQPESFDRLHNLLETLPFRLAYWKTAVHEINYRRFFDINELAGLRVEEPAAFKAMHQLILRLIGEGVITGIRLDHVDGLFDPCSYASELQAAVRAEIARRLPVLQQYSDPAAAVESWGRETAFAELSGPVARPLYVVVEKILTGEETLPPWPTEGTTGYDFMNDVSRLFVNPRSAPALRQFHRSFTERTDPYREVVYDCKKLITWTSLAAELNVLAESLNRFSEGDRRARDFTLDSLREALREVAVCFPVYRTYVGPLGATEADRQVVDQAIQRARSKNPAMETSVFDFVRANLLAEQEGISEELYQARLHFAMKFQQYTGPLQAKGIEDTAFYRYNVLVSLNEVGNDPQRFGGTIVQFHNANQQRLASSPLGILSTATHDTKRGEDARTRIHVLSEAPRTWRKRVREWATINAACRSIVEGTDAPDRNDEYLFYQTLLGCWPAELVEPKAPPELVERVRNYMLKAIKEAKTHTSWISPNEAYDQAMGKYVEEVLTGQRSRQFLKRFLPFQRQIAKAGMINSLAQVVLKAASPGVPDFYQGTELWELSLVDPDNRRPVDYAKRMEYLTELEAWIDNPTPPKPRTEAIARWLRNWPDGRIKLYITACVLRLRKQHASLFFEGEYIPIATEGDRAEQVVAFARRRGDEWVLTVVPRLSAGLNRDREFDSGSKWGNTALRLPASFLNATVRNVLSGEELQPTEMADEARLRVGEVFATCPVALLHYRAR